MGIKKIEIRPKGSGAYGDILHPITSTSAVKVGNTEATLDTKLASIEADILATNIALDGKLDASNITGDAVKLETARYIDGVAFDGTKNIKHYTTCETDGALFDKNCLLEGFNLEPGARITVKFTNANTNATPMLMINGTASVALYKADGSWFTDIKAGGVYTFVYDGTAFILQGESGVKKGNLNSVDNYNIHTGTATPKNKNGIWITDTSVEPEYVFLSDGNYLGNIKTYSVSISSARFIVPYGEGEKYFVASGSTTPGGQFRLIDYATNTTTLLSSFVNGYGSYDTYMGTPFVDEENKCYYTTSGYGASLLKYSLTKNETYNAIGIGGGSGYTTLAMANDSLFLYRGTHVFLVSRTPTNDSFTLTLMFSALPINGSYPMFTVVIGGVPYIIARYSVTNTDNFFSINSNGTLNPLGVLFGTGFNGYTVLKYEGDEYLATTQTLYKINNGTTPTFTQVASWGSNSTVGNTCVVTSDNKMIIADGGSLTHRIQFKYPPKSLFVPWSSSGSTVIGFNKSSYSNVINNVYYSADGWNRGSDLRSLCKHVPSGTFDGTWSNLY